jgi:hypothetical protein
MYNIYTSVEKGINAQLLISIILQILSNFLSVPSAMLQHTYICLYMYRYLELCYLVLVTNYVRYLTSYVQLLVIGYIRSAVGWSVQRSILMVRYPNRPVFMYNRVGQLI